MSNHLARESSPYLLEHAQNPVDWYAWGPEALDKARIEDKPIFLSIGYAACHWCHVMAHESFENSEIARLLNQYYVCIKVDREERPDLDSIYMSAVVAMTGQGGWPMSVFLTPDGQPFYGGTYFPPVPRYGMPAFTQVLTSLARSWREERKKILEVGEKLTQHLQEATSWSAAPDQVLDPGILRRAEDELLANYDWQHGGWGAAPKFPAPMTLEFLLAQAARGGQPALQAAVHALNAMQRGGMWDTVSGGFHRYSTDADWLVPHFEKMLYDNAQLALVYLHAYQLTGKPSFRRTCERTLDFILRELSHPAGGFYSSLDADSEGEEGKYYLFSMDEIRSCLADDTNFNFFSTVYPLEPGGVFEGRYIFQANRDEEAFHHALGLTWQDYELRISRCLQALQAHRQKKVRPRTDDKILTSWNALALRAFSAAASSLGRPDYLAAAQKNADFLLTALYRDGKLMRSWRAGLLSQPAFLEDYAGLILGLISLYQADFNPSWYAAARQLAIQMDQAFLDPAGGYFDTRADHFGLLLRPKDLQDNATPSGNALACLANLTLAEFSNETSSRTGSEGILSTLSQTLAKYPAAFSFWLQALDFAVGPVSQVALVWPQATSLPGAFLDACWQKYRPRSIIAGTPYPPPAGGPALLANRLIISEAPTAYLCRGFTCLRPTTDLDEFITQMNNG